MVSPTTIAFPPLVACTVPLLVMEPTEPPDTTWTPMPLAPVPWISPLLVIEDTPLPACTAGCPAPVLVMLLVLPNVSPLCRP